MADYDWQALIQAIMSLVTFVVSRHSDICDSPGFDDFSAQLLLTLDFLAVWADVILPNTDAVVQLFYEILRSQESLTKLGNLITSANQPQMPLSPRLSPTSPTIRRSGSGFNTPAPRSPTFATAPTFLSMITPQEPCGPAAESIRNLNVVISHLGGKLEESKEKSSNNVDAEQLLEIIKGSMDTLDLRESMALEDIAVRKFTEQDHKKFFADLIQVVTKDILEMTRTK